MAQKTRATTRRSNLKKRRTSGYRARMATKAGRKILAKRRRQGRKLTTV